MLFSRSSAPLLALALLGACATSTSRPTRPHGEHHVPKSEGYDAERCIVSEWKEGPNGCSFSEKLKGSCEADGPCPAEENVQFHGTFACGETRAVCGQVQTCRCPAAR